MAVFQISVSGQNKIKPVKGGGDLFEIPGAISLVQAVFYDFNMKMVEF